MEVASDGMPHSGRLGFELFDKLNWGQTEFDEKVNYQRALEGELERSIQTLRDVESVRVHLVMSTDSVFLDRERPAKASVILKLRTGRLSQETQQGIARLVSGAVDKLIPENVTVIDADTNRPLGTPNHGAYSADGSLEQEYSTRLLQTLEPVVGRDHVRASVNVEYDPSSSEESQETYDPKSAVAVASQTAEEQAGGGSIGGVPGTSSNVPGAGGGAKPVADGDGSQVSKSASTTFAVNKIIRHVVEPAGRIRRISAALLVDDAIEVKQENGKRSESRRKRTPDELKQIEDLAKAAIGVDTNRGDSVTVQNLSFEETPVDGPGKPTATERIRTVLNDWSSIVRYAALILLFLLVYALLLRPLKKQLLTTFRELPARIAARKPQDSDGAAGELIPGKQGTTLSGDQQRTIALKKQLVEKANAEPAATGKLVQAWLNEGSR
jgi:flagellar M-ring protein FliF